MSYHLSIVRNGAPALSDTELLDKLPRFPGFHSSEQSGPYAVFYFKPDGLERIAVHWTKSDLWAERVESVHIPFLAAITIVILSLFVLAGILMRLVGA